MGVCEGFRHAVCICVDVCVCVCDCQLAVYVCVCVDRTSTILRKSVPCSLVMNVTQM